MIEAKQEKISKRNVALNIFSYASCLGIMYVVAFVTLPIWTHNLPTEQYGIWAQIGSTIGLMSTLITFGFNTSVVRFLSGRERQTISSLYHSMLAIVLSNSVLFVFLTLLFREPLSGIIFGDSSLGEFVPMISLLLLSEATYMMVIAYLRSQNLIVRLSIMNSLRSIVQLMILWVIVAYLKEGIYEVLIAYIATNLLLSGIIYYFDIYRDVGLSLKLPDGLKGLKEVFIFSLPFLPNGVLLWALDASDRYFIVHMLGMSENAVYSLTYGIVKALIVVFTALGFVIFPLLVKYWEDNDKKGVRNILEKFTMLSLYLVIPAICGLYVLGEDIILLFATPEYLVSSSLILWVSLGMMFYGIYQINGYVIHLIKKTYYNTLIFFIAAAINIALNLILIKQIGIYGAAVSTCISYLFLAIVVSAIAMKAVNYRINLRFIAKCIVASAVMFIAIAQIQVNSPQMLVIVSCIGVLIYLSVSYMLKIFTSKDIRDVLQFRMSS